MTAVRGILKDGRVTLLEPIATSGEVPVIVTLLDNGGEPDFPELAAKSESLREIWDDPRLDAYNDA